MATNVTNSKRTISITGVDHSTTSDTVLYYFESKRGANVDATIEYDEDNRAYLITFDEDVDLPRLLRKDHKIDGVVVSVSAYVPPKHYPDKILLKGIDERITKETLLFYIEAKTKKEVIDVSDLQNGKAIVTFKEGVDVQFVENKIQEKPLGSCRLSAHSVRESNVIIVSGLPPRCSDSTLEYYFDNKKRSGVEGVTDVTIGDDHQHCLVYFENTDAPVQACKRQHRIEGCNLKVAIHHKCLGLPGSNDVPQEPSVGYLNTSKRVPEPVVIEGVDKKKLKFIKSVDDYRKDLDKRILGCHGEVDWEDASKSKLVIGCTLSPKDTASKDWASEVRDELNRALNSITVVDFSLDENIRKNVLHEVQNSAYKNDVTFIDEGRQLSVIGELSVIEKLQPIIQSFVDNVSKEVNNPQSYIDCIPLKHFQLEMLEVIEFKSEIGKLFDGVSVTINRDNTQIIMSGPEDLTKKAKLHTYEILNKIQSKILAELSPELIRFISKGDVSRMITAKLEQHDVRGTWILEGHDVVVYAMSRLDVDTASSVWLGAVQECSCVVSDWQMSVISSKMFLDFTTQMINEYESRSVIVEVERKNDKIIVLTSSIHENDAEGIVTKIKQFLEDHGEQTTHYTLGMDKLKLFHELMQEKITEMMDDLKDKEVSVIFQPDGILVKGKSEDFKLAKTKLEALLTFVNVVADNPKFQKVVQRVKKKGELRQVSYDGSSSDSDDDDMVDDDYGGRCFVRYNDIQDSFKAAGGQEVIIVKADITELEVHVIVNGSNRDLLHKGGLAKAIVNKGGKIIQDECSQRIQIDGPLNEGEVFCSKPGNLRSKMVVHAVGPMWRDGHHKESDNLIACVESALAATEKNRFSSIAIPALCTGISRFPPDLAVDSIVLGIKDYFKWHPSSSIRTICLCDIVDRTIQNYLNACQKYFNQQSTLNAGRHVEHKRVKIGKIEVKLVKGQLSSMKVGAIVNTTSRKLNLEQGIVSASLLKAGGPSLQQECTANYPQGINFGEVATTTGGQMNCQIVCHVCLQPWRSGGSQTQEFEKCVVSCLYEANKRKCASVAFPAMGTGKLGYPSDVVANTMYSCVEKFAKKNADSALKEVLFVLYDRDHKTVQAFQDEEKRRAASQVGTTERPVSAIVYKRMTDEEKRGIVKEAFDARQVSETRLRKTEEEMRKKEKRLYDLQTKISDRKLFMRGEKEALDGNTVKYFDLYPVRSYEEGSAAQTHFRLAESQFYRLMAGRDGNCSVNKVQYIVNPPLVKQFNQTREKFKKSRGDQESRPILVFHGTQDANIKPIVENNFKVPGQQGFQHRTDTGYYGRGVYFSEYPKYSMSYIQGTQQLLMSQILPGKVYRCTGKIQGSALQTGYDSHLSPDGNEWVIFDNKQILPFYIVHYTTGAFTYGKKP